MCVWIADSSPTVDGIRSKRGNNYGTVVYVFSRSRNNYSLAVCYQWMQSPSWNIFSPKSSKCITYMSHPPLPVLCDLCVVYDRCIVLMGIYCCYCHRQRQWAEKCSAEEFVQWSRSASAVAVLHQIHCWRGRLSLCLSLTHACTHTISLSLLGKF